MAAWTAGTSRASFSKRSRSPPSTAIFAAATADERGFVTAAAQKKRRERGRRYRSACSALGTSGPQIPIIQDHQRSVHLEGFAPFGALDDIVVRAAKGT